MHGDGVRAGVPQVPCAENTVWKPVGTPCSLALCLPSSIQLLVPRNLLAYCLCTQGWHVRVHATRALCREHTGMPRWGRRGGGLSYVGRLRSRGYVSAAGAHSALEPGGWGSGLSSTRHAGDTWGAKTPNHRRGSVHSTSSSQSSSTSLSVLAALRTLVLARPWARAGQRDRRDSSDTAMQGSDGALAYLPSLRTKLCTLSSSTGPSDVAALSCAAAGSWWPSTAMRAAPAGDMSAPSPAQ